MIATKKVQEKSINFMIRGIRYGKIHDDKVKEPRIPSKITSHKNKEPRILYRIKAWKIEYVTVGDYWSQS